MTFDGTHLLLAIAWLLWCFLHSVTISGWWMRRMNLLLGKRIAYYRFAYVLFSLLTLLPVVYLQLRIDSPMLWSWPSQLQIVQWSGIAISLLIFLSAARQYDQKFFLGFRQIREHLAGSEADYAGFSADGILRFMRHPYYAAGILLLLFYGDLTLANLILKMIGIGYFIVGAFLEEKKLIEQFGEQYKRYQQEVPMFFPNPFSRRTQNRASQ